MSRRLLYIFDLKKAYDKGLKGSVIDIMNKLGYNLTNYEMIWALDCAIVETRRNNINDPSYIIQVPNCWEFDFIYPL